MLFTAGDIAAKLGGKVLGDHTMPLTGFQAADRARAGDLTFAENRTFFERAEQSAASAIIIDKTFTSERKVLIRVPSARIAFAKVVPLFYPEPGPPHRHPFFRHYFRKSRGASGSLHRRARHHRRRREDRRTHGSARQ
ncbi:hypothetical protein OAJ79_03410 [Verrucomicrobia bacterium]|nr:hypothetical protein [Verrucomicrobiota bacterium]